MAPQFFLVRERMRETKKEVAFKKVKGKVLGQLKHTISFVLKSGKGVTMSKKDLAWIKGIAVEDTLHWSKSLYRPNY